MAFAVDAGRAAAGAAARVRRERERKMGGWGGDARGGVRPSVKLHHSRNPSLGYLKVAIGDDERGASVLAAGGMRESEIVRAVQIVDQMWREFLRAWGDIHGQEDT